MEQITLNDLYLLGLGIGCVIAWSLGFNGGQQR